MGKRQRGSDEGKGRGEDGGSTAVVASRAPGGVDGGVDGSSAAWLVVSGSEGAGKRVLLRRGMPGEGGSDVMTMLEGGGVEVGYVVAWRDGKFSAHATVDGGLRYAQGGGTESMLG